MRIVVVLDFGYTDNPDVPSSIHDLGDCVLARRPENRDDTVVLAQSATYAYLCKKSLALSESGRLHEIKVEQSGSNNLGGVKDGGSYFVLKRAYAMLGELNLPAVAREFYLVAHRCHVIRAMRQAHLVGFGAVTPYYEVPSKFYRAAAQWWCRSSFLWNLREMVGYIPLKLSGQI